MNAQKGIAKGKNYVKKFFVLITTLGLGMWLSEKPCVQSPTWQ